MATYDGFNIVAPKELIVPMISGALAGQPQISGALFISGANLYYMIGLVPQKITSAAS